jgi:hypothetical protein
MYDAVPPRRARAPVPPGVRDDYRAQRCVTVLVLRPAREYPGSSQRSVWSWGLRARSPAAVELQRPRGIFIAGRRPAAASSAPSQDPLPPGGRSSLRPRAESDGAGIGSPRAATRSKVTAATCMTDPTAGGSRGTSSEGLGIWWGKLRRVRVRGSI